MDLSRRHELVGDLFRVSISEAGAFRLSEEQVAHYHEQGYVAGVRVLTDEQVESLRAELDELFDPESRRPRAVVRISHQ